MVLKNHELAARLTKRFAVINPLQLEVFAPPNQSLYAVRVVMASITNSNVIIQLIEMTHVVGIVPEHIFCVCEIM